VLLTATPLQNLPHSAIHTAMNRLLFGDHLRWLGKLEEVDSLALGI
jgi:hypothetical protein